MEHPVMSFKVYLLKKNAEILPSIQMTVVSPMS